MILMEMKLEIIFHPIDIIILIFIKYLFSYKYKYTKKLLIP